MRTRHELENGRESFDLPSLLLELEELEEEEEDEEEHGEKRASYELRRLGGVKVQNCPPGICISFAIIQPRLVRHLSGQRILCHPRTGLVIRGQFDHQLTGLMGCPGP